MLKLNGRHHAVVEVEGARAGRAAVVGAWRWLEANGVPKGRGGGGGGNRALGVSLFRVRGGFFVEVEGARPFRS